MEQMIVNIQGSFNIKDLGEPEHLLSIKISRNRDIGTIHISHPSFIVTIAKRFTISPGHPITSPMNISAELKTAMDSDETINI